MALMDILTLLGGMGMFLYGMNLMSGSIQRVAGSGLERMLERLTNNRLKGVLLGAGVTAVIQSSAATAVMVIGFVNAGIMKLAQAIPVIMGANIGTTITGQILRLGDIDGQSSILLTLLKPSSFAPVLVAAGAAILLISKKKKTKDIAGLIIGFGILFIGITTMERTLSASLSGNEQFRKLFTMFKNPLLGVLVGAVVTAILQSSSASVGVLQAISATGNITFSMAAPIIMGQNIGKCITVILASIGTNKKAKRAVLIDLMVNVIGAIVFLVGVYGFQALIGFSFWDEEITRGGIANFHTLFNLVTTILLLPLCNLLIKLSGKIIKHEERSKMDEELALLNDIFLKTPSVALEQCKKVLNTMGDTVKENYAVVLSQFDHYSDKQRLQFEENEKFLDRIETVLVDYLVKITGKDITDKESRMATEFMHSIRDFEKIGDYCEGLLHVAEFNYEKNITFSEIGKREFSYVSSAARTIIDTTVEAYQTENITVASRVAPLEETIDMMEEMLKNKHIERLQSGHCSTSSGISFVEILTNIERIAGHCSNIALHLIQRLNNDESLIVHDRMKSKHNDASEEYKAMYRYYESLYSDPVKDDKQTATCR